MPLTNSPHEDSVEQMLRERGHQLEDILVALHMECNRVDKKLDAQRRFLFTHDIRHIIGEDPRK